MSAHLLTQAPDSAQSFRSAYNALMDSYDSVFQQEGDVRGEEMVAMQRLTALPQRAMQSRTLKSLPFPSASTVIDARNNTLHGDQITYGAPIAFQVTSGILAAAAWTTRTRTATRSSTSCMRWAAR